jgi:hypothetical protein
MSKLNAEYKLMITDGSRVYEKLGIKTMLVTRF